MCVYKPILRFIGQNIQRAVLTSEPREMWSLRNTKVQIFFVWNENWSIRALLYNHNKLLGKFSKRYRKFSGGFEKLIMLLSSELCTPAILKITLFAKRLLSQWTFSKRQGTNKCRDNRTIYEMVRVK